MSKSEYNLEQTTRAIETEWCVSHTFDLEGRYDMAEFSWKKTISSIQGMWAMANYVLHCDDTKEYLSDLEAIARMHYDRSCTNSFNAIK